MHQSTQTAFCIFSGAGGGALGLQWARREFRGLAGRFEVLGGIDSDPAACEDFGRLTSVPAACLDLFDRDQYRAWHGKEPPDDWAEVTLEQIRAAAQHRRPDVVLITAPCKGFSGLLGEANSRSPKYQASNRLTERAVFLALEAWRDNLPGVILFENVPRIASRGKRFLTEIKSLLAAYGYFCHESHHCCGEIGGLGQRRKRYLLIARQPDKLRNFVYRPPKLSLRSIGDVIESLPMPDDPAAGPMHRLPRLQWRTWVRLALIPPGGDWRDLQGIEAGRYRITAEMNGEHWNKYRVEKWGTPAHSVTGSDRLGSGAPSIADPRLNHIPMGNGKGAFWVQDAADASGTVTADPGHRKSGGASVVADPRIGHAARDASMRVGDFSDPSGPVTGHAGVTSSNAMGAVADPRYAREPRRGVYQVQDTADSGSTVTAGKDPNGNMTSVADPRQEFYGNHLRMNDTAQPANAVTGAAGPNQGANLIADPRMVCAPRSGTMGVTDWEQTSAAVLGSGDIHNGGAGAVADPRIPEDSERGVWVIVSPHQDSKGRHCWHRPLTTLELAALQGFPVTMPDGSPLALAGSSDRRWRERIGNALPPPAMQAIAEQVLESFLQQEAEVWEASATPVWVEPRPQQETEVHR